MAQEIHIMMVGPSRSGKTSIIAALKNVNRRANNAFLKYGITLFENTELNSVNSEDLKTSYEDMKNLSKSTDRPFLTALYGTQENADYHLGLDFNKQDDKGNAIKKMNFVFHDVPGEAYRMYDAQKISKLEDTVTKCSVMIIAVDYPALKLAEYFEEEEDETSYLSTFMCDEALTRLLPKLGQQVKGRDDGSPAPKLVVIVPIKCESYMQDEELTQEMYATIRKRFSDRLESIGTTANVRNVKILTMPIQTIGNVYASRDYDDQPKLCVFDNHKYPVSKRPITKERKMGSPIKLSEDARLMDFDGEEHYIARCTGSGSTVTLFCGEPYTLGAGDRVISAREFYDIPYSIRQGYPIPYIWYYADGSQKFSPDNEDQLLMELMKFQLQSVAFATGKSMDSILSSKGNSTLGTIIKSILLGLLWLPLAALPWLLQGHDNQAILAQMVKTIQQMRDNGEFKSEYDVLYNTLDADGPLKI
ncbi:MAG: hypothetical protein IJ767_05360 [Bacteroidaceae bacterium]|nr:hypothetical protein [Bacteroidaceae bacterium]